jgi:hypothetical protein
VISNEGFRAEVISNIAEQLCNDYPTLDPLRAASIAAGIFERDEKREAASRGVKVSNKLIRARLDCLIFFRLVEVGWGQAKRLPSGATVAENSPLTWDWRLNFPKRSRLAAASRRVRQICSEEAAQYKQAWRDWREARKRYLATETEEFWEWYRAGKGNRNSVAYRSKMDLSRRGGEQYFRTRRLFRYTLHELLPRLQEGERALREMQEATEVMKEMRELIFERMNVPDALRSYV